MMKFLLFFTSFFLCYWCFGQINFQQGYYLDNEGNRVNGLIRNVDWKNNPDSFSFKTNNQSESVEISVSQAREFVVFDNFEIKFRRFSVKIDRSSDVISSLSSKREPEFNDEELYLKVMVEGEASSLYYYEGANLRRFFYGLNEDMVSPLIYKKYLNKQNRVAENNHYKQELLNTLTTRSYDAKKVENMDYAKQDLVDYFLAYNSEKGKIAENYYKRYRRNKVKVHLSLQLGVTNQSFVLESPNTLTDDTDFGNQLGIRAGIEIESVLPFNKNKWALFAGANYKSFSSDTTFDQEGVLRTAETDFDIMDIPLGIRHYFFLSDRSKLFVNVSYNIVVVPSTNITIENRSDLEVGGSMGLGFGAGYNFDDKLGMELRYNTYDDILVLTERESTFQGISLVLHYKVF